MAAAGLALSGVANIAQPVNTYVQKTVKEFERDPFLWLEEKLWKWGWGLLAMGFIAAAVGVLLRAAGVRAANDMKGMAQQEAALFGNLSQGPVVRTDMSWNIGDDISKTLNNAVNVVEWPFVEVGKALSDIGQAITMAARNFPRWAGDTLSLLGGMLVGGMLDFIFPFMIVFGAIFVAVAAAMRFVRSVIIPRVHIWGRARFQHSIAEPLDRLFGTQRELKEAVKERLATQRVEVIGGEETTAEEAVAAERIPQPTPGPAAPSIIEVGDERGRETQEGGAGTPNEAGATPEGEGPEAPSPGEAEETPVAEPEKPLPLATPTEEVESKLGEVPYSDAKRKLRAALREKEARKSFRQLVKERADEDREAATSEMRRALESRGRGEAQPELAAAEA